MTSADILTTTVERVTTLVEHYQRDRPFRAPEAVPEHQARLLNDLWMVLQEGQQAAASEAEAGRDAA